MITADIRGIQEQKSSGLQLVHTILKNTVIIKNLVRQVYLTDPFLRISRIHFQFGFQNGAAESDGERLDDRVGENPAVPFKVSYNKQ